MSDFQEIYVRETRDQLGKYPNWPLQRKLELGSIGLFNGRRARFDWEGSLGALGIDVKPSPPQFLLDETYKTAGRVNIRFDGAPGAAKKCDLEFRRFAAFATQPFRPSVQALPINRLQDAIVAAVREKRIEWDLRWVVVTELWHADAFTALISGSRAGRAEISARRPKDDKPFNLADLDIGVTASRSQGMRYLGVAEQSVFPFFQVHRLIHDRANDRHYLKHYGPNSRSHWATR